MGITIYSVVISVVLFNVALIAAFLMRRSSTFLARHTVSFLLLMVLFGIIRLLTPIDFDKAFVVRSYQVIPAIEDFINRPIARNYTLGSLLLLVWLAGTVIFLARDIVTQIRFVSTSRNYPPSDRRDLVDLAGEYGSNFGLLVSSSISRPYTAGLFRPAIYLPDIELPEESWRTILRHEIQHIRSRDEAKKLFFLATQALFWWNPLAHISLKEIDTLLELQCDAKVTSGMSFKEVNSYFDTLISLKNLTANRLAPVDASYLVWDQKQLVTRFEALQNAGQKANRRPQIIAYLLLICIFILSYFVIIQPKRLPSEVDLMDGVPNAEESHLMEYTCSTSEMYIKVEKGEYHLFVDGFDTGVLDEASLFVEPFNTLPIWEDYS